MPRRILVQTECVSGQMLCGVVPSYTLPEWDRICVLSFIMQLDDSSCDNPWLYQAASLT